jgi:rhodanese-related sulfurtransferase
MKKILFTILALLGGQNAMSAYIESVSANEAAKMQNERHAIIVDVRETDEWNAGHIAGAIHIPLGDVKNRVAELEKFKDSPVITQCRSGARSAKAAEVLKNAGFSAVYNLDGGINAWQKAALDIQQN